MLTLPTLRRTALPCRMRSTSWWLRSIEWREPPTSTVTCWMAAQQPDLPGGRQRCRPLPLIPLSILGLFPLEATRWLKYRYWHPVASTGNNGIGAETDLTITTTDCGTTGAIAYSANDSAAQIATAINSAASNIGITATATNSVTLDTLTAAGTVSFNLSGQDGVAGTAISAVVSDNNDCLQLLMPSMVHQPHGCNRSIHHGR